MASFADRLNAVFAAFLQPSSPGRRPVEWPDMTVAQVAVDVMPTTDRPALSRQYLGMLRRGKRTRPSLQTAKGIAAAFAELSRRSGVPCSAAAILDYLIDDEAVGATAEDLRAKLAKPSDGQSSPSEVTLLARQGADLNSPEALDSLAALLDQLAQQDAEPLRQRLARLLGVRSHGGSDPTED